MRALVVYETMFGNTGKIARAVADGLSVNREVTLTDVADAPTEVPSDVDLVVVGGPTHAFSMSRYSTRHDAERRGGARNDVDKGIREWLKELPASSPKTAFAAFDTRVDMPLLPGAASRSATRLARRRGFTVRDPESFFVRGYQGPLVDGELDRAREWGQLLSYTSVP